MVVNDCMLYIQSRLSDLKTEKWSEAELLDCINLAYIELANVLRLFIEKKSYEITDSTKENFLALPSNFIDIIKVKHKNFTIPIIRYDSIIDNANILNAINAYASILSNTLIIHGNVGIYDLYFYCYFLLIDKKDRLLIPDICFHALCFYSIYLALQKKPHMQASQEMAMYRSLYEEELKKCKFSVFKAKETQNLTSAYIRV